MQVKKSPKYVGVEESSMSELAEEMRAPFSSGSYTVNDAID
jgi:hypothetical protein